MFRGDGNGEHHVRTRGVLVHVGARLRSEDLKERRLGEENLLRSETDSSSITSAFVVTGTCVRPGTKFP